MFRKKRRYQKAVRDTAQHLANLGATAKESGYDYTLASMQDCDTVVTLLCDLENNPLFWIVFPVNPKALGLKNQKKNEAFLRDIDSALAATKPNKNIVTFCKAYMENSITELV